jgi:serine/threonine protein kinase
MLSELPPHPNVVQMYGISTDGPTVVLVLEYCDGGMKERNVCVVLIVVFCDLILFKFRKFGSFLV